MLSSSDAHAGDPQAADSHAADSYPSGSPAARPQHDLLAADQARRAAHDAAYRGAYVLLEAVQGENHEQAAAALAAARHEAERAGWTDVSFMLQVADTVHQLGRVDRTAAAALTTDLLRRAESMRSASYRAIALGLSALSTSEDAARLIAQTARAVALLDDETLPGMSRCVGYVIAAAACNCLGLYELVEEFYQHALRLQPACDEALQSEAIAVNRVLVMTEWALALVENADPAAADRFEAVAEATAVALQRPLRPLWRADVLACRDIVRLLAAESVDELRELLPSVRQSVQGYHQLLVDSEDVEGLPSLNAALALAESRAGYPTEPGTQPRRRSLSTGARTFPLWARAQILATGLPPEAAQAQHEYAQLVSRLRWQSRGVVLAAARAQIEAERSRSEHDRLRQAVETDVLTGLKNRRVFDRVLRECTGPVALLLIDIDGFKPINDTFGHHVGDEVLRRIGLLMRQSCRTEDLAIRQGGDEFALVLRGESVSRALAVEVAGRFSALVARQPWRELGEGLDVSVSIGLACGRVAGGSVDQDEVLTEARLLYLAADAALYESKRTGGPVAAAPARLAS
ncbi:MAG TPA: GGDEF domain-containing protein [Jatrophihabitans sp.]|nr:GGDEF domain-containing protein [Jatrophihabitans sp.]